MTDKEKDFLHGLAISVACSALPCRKNIPIAYLYNGVRLPPLPEWDREKYPCLYITGRPPDFYLYALPDGEYLFNGSYWVIPDGVYGLFDGWNSVIGGDWKFRERYLAGLYLAPLWCNTDILNEDGTVFLSASEPVPVYE